MILVSRAVEAGGLAFTVRSERILSPQKRNPSTYCGEGF